MTGRILYGAGPLPSVRFRRRLIIHLIDRLMPSKKSDLPDLEQRVLAFITRPGYQPVKPKVIAKKLGLTKDEVVELKRVLRQLIKRGQVVWGVSHLVRPVAGGVEAGDGAGDDSRVVGVF